MLVEIFTGAGEPMPYDFLAIQPAIAAAHLQPHLSGLEPTYFPAAAEGAASWALLLALAARWLAAGRYAQVLCAHSMAVMTAIAPAAAGWP